ncbi:aldehyde dehydrogenase family protein [Cnuibacter physcomitrellae]|uniref:aldehyde dehydrogenase family protein n=1 Tax=Cnuibacter physcomitrellae TaxID=1619308 RepID=UPI002176129A|nr:aldehyde dehydrogenase family protein [Cnuibacter physcomitrellae]MCS5497876.1 aldehyde dehydrogenase family protein [Cnuibacter physcomitrellae]
MSTVQTTTRARNLIGGEWVGDADFERRNPARPDEVASVAPSSSADQVDEAITAAVDAQPGWAALPLPARGAILLAAGEILRERRSDVAADLVREEGKTLAEATGEVGRAIDVLRFFGGLGWAASGQVLPSATPGTTIHTRREPLGVVGLITPWNFPIAIPAWKTAPALLAGNSVVLKPAELTPASASHLAAALVEAGLPAGVLNIVHGKGSIVGDALAHDRRIAGLSFTGSTAVGLGLHGVLSARRARVQLEMGGKNAVLVLDDADPRRAAQVVAAGGFGLTGQACTATSRVYATPGVLSALVDELGATARAHAPGDGLDAGTTMGVVVSEQQLEKDLEAISGATSRGGRLVTGGRAEGLALSPAVLTDVAGDDPVVTEEVFGPVVAVLPTDDYESGLAAVNDSPYGLTAGIVTDSLARATDFSERVQAGVVKVNRPTAGLDLNVPFGGVKDSSTNTFREQGATALDFFTWGKTVYTGV